MCLEDIRRNLLKITSLKQYYKAIESCDPGLVYKIPNVIRYNISIDYNGKIDISFEANYNQSLPKIIIILESPHTEEYKNIHKLRPANGATGDNIKNQLYALIKKLLSVGNLQNNQSYNFCIVNPVPYQASLGFSPQDNDMTVAIWKAIWENLGYKDKFNKLIRYLPSDSIVLNACTNKSDNNGYNIKDEVQGVINQHNVINYTLHHPSSDSYPEQLYTQSIKNIK
ncbi:hypothetical protein J7552_09495 [Wohlfahrtiimonas chitiniclastica]|uniref:hypothetical protein n=1 Tax=Wohlfahrtiimonas chitiniclastica TaxID=400946 RepID=UPI001BCAAE76|nr:hypothetical protein [Wohlfahrtiimonas chitiniclastica]MBS7821511.1 hypothetical protein [Wohlfahrtiimonas chitiniclastica]